MASCRVQEFEPLLLYVLRFFAAHRRRPSSSTSSTSSRSSHSRSRSSAACCCRAEWCDVYLHHGCDHATQEERVGQAYRCPSVHVPS